MIMCKRWRCFKRVDKVFVRHFVSLTVLTFCVVLPLICLHLPHSLYYKLWGKNVDIGRDRMRMENDKRIEEAKKILKKFEDTGSLSGLHSPGAVDVGITIITVSRNRHRLDQYEPTYLTQVVAKFLKYLEDTSGLKHTYQLFLCDVDPNPSSYNEIIPLAKLVPVFQRYLSNSSRLDMWNTLSISERLEKEKKDYIFCGQQTLNKNVSSVFLVEDDALPHEDLLPVLDRVVTNIFDKSKADRVHYHRNVSYIKFYHPERLLGYISLEMERLPELFGLSFLLSTILTLCYKKYRPVAASYTLILWACFFAYSCLFWLVIGRQNLMELRRVSSHLYQVTPAPSCCTPAILYPRKGMIEVINYLSKIHCKENFGKDIALEEFRVKFKKTALMIQPNLFTHIGMYSSLRNVVLDPFIV